MNQQVLLKCQKMMIKLEMHPLYIYFLNNYRSKKQNQATPDLRQIKNKLTLNEYQSKEDWLNELTFFFKRIIDKKSTSPILKKSAQSVLDEINKKYKKIYFLNSDDWTSVFCHTYQELANLIAVAPKGLGISQLSCPMQLAGTTIEFSEHELIEMRKQLEQNLNDKEKKLVAQLIISLESDAVFDGKTIEFDLARLKSDTLLAIRTFLNSHKSKLSSSPSNSIQLFG